MWIIYKMAINCAQLSTLLHHILKCIYLYFILVQKRFQGALHRLLCDKLMLLFQRPGQKICEIPVHKWYQHFIKRSVEKWYALTFIFTFQQVSNNLLPCEKDYKARKPSVLYNSVSKAVIEKPITLIFVRQIKYQHKKLTITVVTFSTLFPHFAIKLEKHNGNRCNKIL